MITVEGRSVTQGRQNYALVVTGSFIRDAELYPDHAPKVRILSNFFFKTIFWFMKLYI